MSISVPEIVSKFRSLEPSPGGDALQRHERIGSSRWRALAYWTIPLLLCLALHWYGFSAWFRGDDFAWMGLATTIHSFPDLLDALFSPRAQGTIRPLSERAFFIAGYSWFGLDPLPFRIVIFATQFANLILLTAIGTRLTGMRAAGFLAAVFWTLNSALVEPLGWTCVYNEVMCGFFLLLAFYFLLRHIETDQRRYQWGQWIAFLLGFGALELNVVYPVLAASYTWLCARRYFRRTLLLFIPAILYVVLHSAVAPMPKAGSYALHIDGSIFTSLLALWSWSVSAVFLDNGIPMPHWILPAGAAIVSAGLLWFAILQIRRQKWPALFCLMWFLVTAAPVLPLRDHLSEYYIYLPLIGLSWLGGWAFAQAWRSGKSARAAAAAVAALYLFMTVPRTLAASQWNFAMTLRAKNLVAGVAHAQELHPGKMILLYGVDTELFLNSVKYRPFWLIGAGQVFLAPGSERAIDAAGAVEFTLPSIITSEVLNRGEAVVYDASAPLLRNITAVYKEMPRDAGLPSRVDAGNPLMAAVLGPEWYANDGNHRWMPRRASLRIAAPAAAGQMLYLRGNCSEDQLRDGPLRLTVAIGDGAPEAAEIRATSFDVKFPLPSSIVGKPEMRVTLEVDHTFRPAGDSRDLGLAFGVFEVR